MKYFHRTDEILSYFKGYLFVLFFYNGGYIADTWLRHITSRRVCFTSILPV